MSSTKLRAIILSVTLFLIAVIPTMAFFLSNNFRSSSSAHQTPKPYASPVTKVASKSATLTAQTNDYGSNGSTEAAASPSPSSSVEPAVTFGPTLNFTAALDGRPTNRQATQMFVGIAQGNPVANPTYLLTFTVDLPDSGKYSGLSIAGLTVGSTYTAYLKGKVQIATASAFLMSPAATELNNGKALTLLSGDLNQDNVVNQADLTIFQAALGSTSSSKNWNSDADFNLDGVVNSVDLAILAKNFNRTGTTGPWISTPQSSTRSASLTQPPSVGSGSEMLGGYWMWVPK